jgi:hypothetical protein
MAHAVRAFTPEILSRWKAPWRAETSVPHCCSVSTFSELKEQAEQGIRAHIGSASSNSAHHFVVDSTNYFVDRGAALLAALRIWAEPRRMTDADLRALIDSANAATLENIAEVLAHSHGPDGLHASLQLEGIAFAPPPQLYATLDFARKGLQPS